MRDFSYVLRSSYEGILKGIHKVLTTLQTQVIKRKKFPELNSHYVNCTVEKAREISSDKSRGQNQKSLFSVPELYLKNSRKIIYKEKERINELKRERKEKTRYSIIIKYSYKVQNIQGKLCIL